MTTFDAILIITIIVSIAYGGMSGFFRSVNGIALLVSSVYLACIFLHIFKDFLISYDAKLSVQALALPILSVLCMTALKSLALLFRQITETARAVYIDHSLGVVWGAVRAAALLKITFWALQYANMYGLIRDSVILQAYAKVMHLPLWLHHT